MTQTVTLTKRDRVTWIGDNAVEGTVVSTTDDSNLVYVHWDSYGIGARGDLHNVRNLRLITPETALDGLEAEWEALEHL